VAADADGAQGGDRDIAIAPDGSFFVYRTLVGGVNQLAVRSFEALDARPLAGSTSSARLGGQARSPFVSHDGQWIGFQDASVLKKISVNGGAALAICPIDGALRGAAWGEDDTIVFATNESATRLFSVSSGGGEPRPLTKPDA
jgi:serine/threonine-protein kinase